MAGGLTSGTVDGGDGDREVVDTRRSTVSRVCGGGLFGVGCDHAGTSHTSDGLRIIIGQD